jgi:hypothetical protein
VVATLAQAGLDCQAGTVAEHMKNPPPRNCPGGGRRVEVAVKYQSTRPAAAWQEPYDALPRSVQQRDDLTYGAKCLYGALRTADNTGWQPTYADLARHVSGSVRSVIRWVQQLVRAGLIAVRRRGQGRPNLFTVLARVTSGDATAPAPAVPKSHPRPSSPVKEERQEGRGTGLKGYTDRRCRRCSGHGRHCDRCSACLPGPHADGACYTT